MRVAALLVLGLCYCGGSVGPAPPPRRPKPKPAPPVSAQEQRTDCEPVKPTEELPALKYTERSVDEGDNLADQAFKMLRRAEDRNVPENQRRRLITDSVRTFIVALQADPYNIHATYNLSAAYARIGRAQCALNLLKRLAGLRLLPSQRDRVEKKLDRLFGRKVYEGRLDPDFFDLRDDPRFRDVVKDLQ